MNLRRSPSRPRGFRFGLGPAGLNGLFSARAWSDVAKRAEDLGYSTLCVGDHLDARPSPGHVALAAALWTTTLRTAVHVFCNDYRHPALLAKEAATMSMLSGGRVDVGLGAGWLRSDYERAGLDFDPPGARIERLAEAAHMVRGAWTNGVALADGRTYTVNDLPIGTTLGDNPPPPLVMGGGGPRMLRLAAEVADIVSINVRLDRGVLAVDRGTTATEELTAEKVNLVRDTAGPRFDDIELQVEVHYVEVTPDVTGGLERAAAELGIPPMEAAASPHVLVGTPSQLAERVTEIRERFGISYFCMRADALSDFAPVVHLVR